MNAESKTQKTTAENSVPLVDAGFKHEVAALPGGENLLGCFACGTCTLSCPVSDVVPSYNPRRIIHMILLGLRHEVLSSATLWYCLSCGRCHLRCPQEVRFPEIMRALRNLAIQEGLATPERLRMVREVNRQSQQQRADTLSQRLHAIEQSSQDDEDNE